MDSEPTPETPPWKQPFRPRLWVFRCHACGKHCTGKIRKRRCAWCQKVGYLERICLDDTPSKN